ncbi:MAG TPA: alpha-glucosidase, partial [Cytophagales bacterium]|nr:alpha-glucosidase [Cytophagales bacterium]
MPSLRLLFFLPFVLWACSPTAEEEHPLSANERAWWKEGIVYQVYPRSFQDTDGDGVGDLKGILQRVDYLDRLGIDIIWLNPIYGSPNDDNGYDISDYQAIMEGFGTMADFDTLLAALHDRGIRLVMDLVVNHTSDEHEWFQQSRASRDSPYRDYYHWWDAENGEPPHRAGFFDPEGKGWLYDEPTNAYYLHYFGRKQPDLKWETPKMRQEIYEMMHWWLKKGVDGFRMDVIPFISKDTTWPIVTEMELLERYQRNIWPAYYASGPNLHSYLQEMNREVLQAYDMMALGEGAGVTIDNAVDFVAKERNELDLFFHFDAVKMGYSKELGYKMLDSAWFDLIQFKDIHTQWSDVFAEQGWGSIYLGNHDQPRMVSRWGNDAPEHRAHSAKLLHTFLLSMRGTPFIYYGDELGMTNLRFDSIEQYRDIETLSWHSQLVSQGIDPAPYL